MTRVLTCRVLGVVAGLALIAGACSSGSGGAAGDAATGGNGDTSAALDVEPASSVEIIAPNFPPVLEALETTLDEEFTAETGISVNVLPVGDTSYDGVDQRIQSDLVAGNPIDMAVIGLSSIRLYADSDRTQSLDGLIDGDTAFSRDEFDPTLFELGERDGAVHAMPYGVSTYTLYYNPEIFEAAGLDPDDPPQTFSELRDAAQAVVDADAADYGIVLRDDHAGDYAFQNFIASAGGSFMNDAEDAVTFNDSTGQDIIQFWADMYADGLGRTMSNDQTAEAFLRSSAAMMLQSSSYIPTLESSASFTPASAPYPIPDDGDRRAVVGGAALAMFATDAPTQAAVWEVIKALVSADGITELVNSSGFSPVNNTAAEGSEHLAGYLQEHPLAEAGWDQLDHLAPWYRYPGPSAVEISEIMQEQIGLAITGDRPVDEALDEAAREAEALLP